METAPSDTVTLTLEAFADTVIPGEKRYPQDRAIAGVATGAGAVAAGALELLYTPATGITTSLEPLSHTLNAHASAYAERAGRSLDDDVPAFVALPYADRAALLRELTAPDHPEKAGWVLLALFSNMAYDIGAHLHTVDALKADHPGLRSMGFAAPDQDGLWRFSDYSYGRQLADRHPSTTASGSPA